MKISILKAIAAVLLLFAGYVRADELVIEVKTDKYASETSWKLFDSKKNMVLERKSFENDKVHFDTVNIDAATCYYWTIYDSYGDGFSNVTTAGYFKVYVNGSIISESKDANYGDSISVYGIGGGCLPNDASVDELFVHTTQTFNPFNVVFSATNMGTDTIKSMTAECTINDGEPLLYQIENIEIPTGGCDTISISDPIIFNQEGNYHLKFTVAKINGVADQDLSNNSLEMDITVKKGFIKKTMLEMFTSSSCNPCVLGNKTLDATIKNYDLNQYSLIKYQMNWPSPGDPYCTSEGLYLKTLYNVTGVPTLFANSIKYTASSFTTDQMEPLVNEISQFSLDIEGEVIGDSAYARATIHALEDASADIYVRIAVVEKTTYKNVTTNGEKEFHNVFMKFITSWQGENIGTLTSGSDTTISAKVNLSKTKIEEFNDLKFVAYIFYKQGNTILQSSMIDVPYTPIAPSIVFSIVDASINVDTLPAITITSSKPLLNADSTSIISPELNVSFFEKGDENKQAEFTVDISDDRKIFSIQTTDYLKANTSYVLKLIDVMSNEGILVDHAEIEFTTAGATSVSTSVKSDLQIYPIPANEFITIDLDENAKWIIYNLDGVNILRGKHNKGKQQLSTEHLQSGVYFMELENNSGKWKKSLIIK